MKRIDGRLSQIDRNKNNLFSEYGTSSNISFLLPEPPIPILRHTSNQIDHDTRWITKPDISSSLSGNPKETFKSTFLESPSNDFDNLTKFENRNNKLNQIREKINHINDFTNSIELNNDLRQENRLLSIKKERENYLKALEIRQKHEKIFSFE